MRKLHFFLGVLLISLFFSIDNAHASHIRAGEITAVRISSLTYRITVTGYRDRSGVEWGEGILSFGHDNEELDLNVEDWTKVNLDEGTEINTYVTTHTFPSTGPYTIRYAESMRNNGILNVNNGASDQIPFYIETQIVIDPSVGLNATPILTVPPIDKGAVGLIYLHNPGAYDREGDSLSYRLVPSKDAQDSPVPNFVLPNDPMFGGSKQDSNAPPTFTLDPYTGDVIWDSPAKAGEYNFAFIIEEWRTINGKPFRLGYVTRDMQVIIEETDNLPPELTIPKDTCVTAGTTLTEFISAMDPDGHDVKIEAYGGVFTALEGGAATFSPNGEFLPSPATGEFRWETSCAHIREQPYEVIFKATDRPPVPAPPLVDLQTWRIRVVAPAPEGLTAMINPGRTVQLNWQNYEASCSGAATIQVWRRVGSYEYEPDNCKTGIPQGAGYELIAETPPDATGYLDDNNGEGLAAGADYCYRLVAVFPQPNGGESYVSEEICAQMAIDIPLITNVDIETTDAAQGEIFVRWTSPLEIDQALFPPPYSYKLFRAEGFSGSANMMEVPLASPFDTTATDLGLNTSGKVYNYRVVLYSGGTAVEDVVDTSAIASSVWLTPTPLVGAIELYWEAKVPWSIQANDYPTHDIYRNRTDPNDPEAFELIASVNVNNDGLFYRDEGLSDKLEYCYFVTTRGSYGHPLLADVDPLINRSQRLCAQPNDTIPPCSPIIALETVDCEAFLENKPCSFNTFSNTLSWSRSEEDACDDDIKAYEIYFSPTSAEEGFTLLATVSATSFVHEDLSSLAGCYFIRAVDRSNNKSEPSETVCNDNCPYYELPNVFTPNDDGDNDVFQAFYPDDPTLYHYGYEKCPRFVESVKIRFYNRWGKEVYSFESNGENSILIKWDGRSHSGQRVPAGVYYYLAEVKFNVLDPAKARQKIKGWVHVMY